MMLFLLKVIRNGLLNIYYKLYFVWVKFCDVKLI